MSQPMHWSRLRISSRATAGAPAQDTSPANQTSQPSRHGMRLRSMSGPSRLLANKLTDRDSDYERPGGYALGHGLRIFSSSRATPASPIEVGRSTSNKVQFGQRIGRGHVDAGDRLRCDDEPAHRTARLRHRFEHALLKELRIGEEQRRIPAKQHQARYLTGVRTARDVVVA